jgi:hypothetical protein
MTNATDKSNVEAAMAAELARQSQREALWAMTREQREAAMWRRELSFFQLTEWSAKRPLEVPRIATDLTVAGEPGEFAWIVMMTPEWAEAEDGPGKVAR